MAPKLSNLLAPFFILLAIHSQPFIVESRTLNPPEKSVNYLQNLEGAQKGQTLKGLQDLKSYLNAFGYYNPQNIKLSDDFHDQLESALQSYQKFYNLKVTGTLDSNTIKQMTIPRCGMPDKVNTRPNSSHSPLVADFTFMGTKWPPSQSHLTYTFLSGAQVVDMQTLRTVIASAFQKWADVSHFTFQEAPEGSQANIVIGFYRGNHGDGNPFDGPGRVLAHAFAPTDGRFHYDADEMWSTNPVNGQMDLESVATHEIGHLLGLGHSQDQNAIMFASIESGAIKRTLGQDDINGIRALYPN